MHLLRYATVLLSGLVLGWVAREITFEKPQARTEPVVRALPAPDPYAPPEPFPDATTPPRPTEMPAAAPVAATPQPQETATEGAGTEEDPFAEMIRSQSPQWKAWAAMQAKQKLGGLFASLGFDEQTQKLIEAALLKDAEVQTERAIAMMLGTEELDPDAFGYFMGLPPDLTPEVEHDLGTFLSDAEIASVRGEVQRAHQKQMDDFADMQIGMMAIPDLTPDQKTRVKDVLAGRDVMKEQFTRFAEFTRDRTKLRRLMEGEGVAEEMQKGFAPTRRRMQDILTPEQFTKYEAYEAQMIRQAEMGVKMMGAMLKTGKGTQTPAPR